MNIDTVVGRVDSGKIISINMCEAVNCNSNLVIQDTVDLLKSNPLILVFVVNPFFAYTVDVGNILTQRVVTGDKSDAAA